MSAKQIRRLASFASGTNPDDDDFEERAGDDQSRAAGAFVVTGVTGPGYHMDFTPGRGDHTTVIGTTPEGDRNKSVFLPASAAASESALRAAMKAVGYPRVEFKAGLSLPWSTTAKVGVGGRTAKVPGSDMLQKSVPFSVRELLEREGMTDPTPQNVEFARRAMGACDDIARINELEAKLRDRADFCNRRSAARVEEFLGMTELGRRVLADRKGRKGR